MKGPSVRYRRPRVTCRAHPLVLFVYKASLFFFLCNASAWLIRGPARALRPVCHGNPCMSVLLYWTLKPAFSSRVIKFTRRGTSPMCTALQLFWVVQIPPSFPIASTHVSVTCWLKYHSAVLLFLSAHTHTHIKRHSGCYMYFPTACQQCFLCCSNAWWIQLQSFHHGNMVRMVYKTEYCFNSSVIPFLCVYFYSACFVIATLQTDMHTLTFVLQKLENKQCLMHNLQS